MEWKAAKLHLREGVCNLRICGICERKIKFCTNGTNKHDFRKRKTRFFFARMARTARFSQAEDTIFLRTNSTNKHDFRKRNIQFFFARFFFIRFFFARMARINTISASGRHDFSSHEWHEQTRFPQAKDTIFQRTNGTNKYDFRKRKTRFFYARMARTNTIFASERHDLFSAFVRDNRVIDLSISSHSFHCARNNRVIDLSISFRSCHSCKK